MVPPTRDASVEDLTGHAAPTMSGTVHRAVAPSRAGAALAPWVAECAVLLLRGSAVVLLLSPALLAAALLLG